MNIKEIIYDAGFYAMFLYTLGFHLFLKWRWKLIWKGICGGNGIPQPNELIKFFAVYVYVIDSGLYMFLNKTVDIPFMVMTLGVVGITTFGKIQERKVKDGATTTEK